MTGLPGEVGPRAGGGVRGRQITGKVNHGTEGIASNKPKVSSAKYVGVTMLKVADDHVAAVTAIDRKGAKIEGGNLRPERIPVHDATVRFREKTVLKE